MITTKRWWAISVTRSEEESVSSVAIVIIGDSKPNRQLITWLIGLNFSSLMVIYDTF